MTTTAKKLKRVEYTINVRTMPMESVDGSPSLETIRANLSRVFHLVGLEVEYGRCQMEETFVPTRYERYEPDATKGSEHDAQLHDDHDAQPA